MSLTFTLPFNNVNEGKEKLKLLLPVISVAWKKDTIGLLNQLNDIFKPRSMLNGKPLYQLTSNWKEARWKKDCLYWEYIEEWGCIWRKKKKIDLNKKLCLSGNVAT